MDSDDFLVNAEEEPNGLSLFAILYHFHFRWCGVVPGLTRNVKKRVKVLEVSDWFWVPVLCGSLHSNDMFSMIIGHDSHWSNY